MFKRRSRLSARALATYANQCPGLNRLKNAEYFGGQRRKRLKSVARGNERDDCDGQGLEILLEFNVLICREHNIEIGRRASE